MFKLFYILIVGALATLVAQPTMNQGNMPEIGTKAEFIFYETENIEPGPAGANQTWDFSNIIKSADQSGATAPEFVSVDEALQKENFPDATIAEKSDTAYTFYRIENNQLIRLGTGYEQGAEILTDYQLQYEIPFTFGDSYTDDFAGTNIVEGFESERTGTIETTADGYGTVIVAGKTYNNALRIKSYIEITDIVDMEFQGFPVTATVTTKLTSHSWLLAGQYYPVISMTEGSAVTEAAGMEYEQEFKNVYGIVPGAEPTLSKPLQLSPENGATDLDIPVTLEWGESQLTSFPQFMQDEVVYTLQVSADNAFAEDTYEYNTSETSYILTELMNSTGYFWRVKASNGDLESEWSEVWSFTTSAKMQELKSPKLIAPDSLAYDISIMPDFEWSNDGVADSWVFSLDNNPQFSMPLIETSVNDNLYTSAMELEYDTEYFWRVKAIAGDDESEWSEVWSFKTESNIPQKPVPTKPENMATEISIMPVMEWDGDEKATMYNLVVSDNSDLMTVIIDINTGETSYTAETELDNETTYYWAVRAGNESGWGEFSEVRSFTTETASSVHFDKDGYLFRIIPNPASESIVLDIKETLSNIQSAEIINISGLSVLKIENDSVLNGNINISVLSAGKYFIRIQADKNYIIPFVKE